MISRMPLYEVWIEELIGEAAMCYLTETFFYMNSHNCKQLLN